MEFWNTILFEMGGRPVLLIDLLSAVFGLTTVFLAGRNRKSNFYVGYVYTALLFFMFWQKNLYANLILQPISLGINILGQYRWSHPKKTEESASGSGDLKVSMLTWPQRGLASERTGCRSGACDGCRLGLADEQDIESAAVS